MLNVGDVLEVTNHSGHKYRFNITRVTDDLAISLNEKYNREIPFKRKISENMAHPPQVLIGTTTYNVIRKEQKEIK